MPELSIRFAVRTDDGRRSDIWKCWTNVGTGKRDVYLTSRPLGSTTLKLSLHESGLWQVAFDFKRKDELFSPEAVPPDRFLGRWQRDAGSDPVVRAAVLLFPWSCPYAAEATDDPIIWIRAAPENQMTEVSIVLINGQLPPDDWPGKISMGMQLVGLLPLEGRRTVAIVYRQCAMWKEAERKQGVPRFFKGMSKPDLANADRMVAWGEGPDGSIMFLESRLIVEGSPQN